jgi:gas vesicle protein
MAEELDRAVQETRRSSSEVLYFLLGLGLGSLISVLLAPQSGDETRHYVSRKAKDASDYAQRKTREVQERAGTLVEQGKEAIQEKKHQVSAAVDAGREAYRQEIAKGKATGVD